MYLGYIQVSNESVRLTANMLKIIKGIHMKFHNVTGSVQISVDFVQILCSSQFIHIILDYTYSN